MRLLAILFLLSATSAQADCPASTIRFGSADPTGVIGKVAANLDTTFSAQACDRLHARYMVGAGFLVASVDVACPEAFGTTPSGIGTVVEDVFTFVGMPAGASVTARVEFRISGEIHALGRPGTPSGGRVTASLETPGAPAATFQRSTTPFTLDAQADALLALPVNAIVGTPVTLRFSVLAEAYEANARLDGVWSFAGLPAGVTVQSCRGYSSAAPVSVRRSTWGAIKASYR